MPSDGKKEPRKTYWINFVPSSAFRPQEGKNSLPPKARFSIWYFLMAFLLFTYLQQYFLSAKVETIPYSQFKQYVAEGAVNQLTIGPEKITGTLSRRAGPEIHHGSGE